MPSVPPARCICGGVKLSFGEDVQPSIIGNCYCNHCALGAGGPAQLNLAFDNALVTVEDPENLIVTYDFRESESGKSKTKFFCGKCGCTMFTRPEFFAGKTFVKASLIEGGCKQFRPQEETFTKYRPSYMNPVEGATQFETQPE